MSIIVSWCIGRIWVRRIKEIKCIMLISPVHLRYRYAYINMFKIFKVIIRSWINSSYPLWNTCLITQNCFDCLNHTHTQTCAKQILMNGFPADSEFDLRRWTAIVVAEQSIFLQSILSCVVLVKALRNSMSVSFQEM